MVDCPFCDEEIPPEVVYDMAATEGFVGADASRRNPDEDVYYCGHPTDDGGECGIEVDSPDARCHWHE